jgi:hypothetical protein
MIIIAKKPGQLGNSLFLFAHFIAFCIEYNLNVMNPAFGDFAKYFPSVNNDLYCRYPKRKTILSSSILREALYLFFSYSGRILNRLKTKNKFLLSVFFDWEESFVLDKAAAKYFSESKIVFAQGWKFRCVELVEKHKKTIQTFFLPSPEHVKNIEKSIGEARKYCDVLVGVHIRHGDYKTFEGGKYFYSLAQYLEQMEKVQKVFTGKKISFLICSNVEIDFSIFKFLNCIGANNHELEDMYSLAACDYIIGPPSTYSMWASFYGSVPLYMIKDAEKLFSTDDFKILY